jgi:hypothetical protein
LIPFPGRNKNFERGEILMKKKEKKKYIKPEVKKNEPLVNITFASAAIPGTGGSPGSAPSV